VQSEGVLQSTGDTARFSLGYVNGGNFQGEVSGVLSEQGDSAWLGEGWVQGMAGGAKLSYHRLADNTVQKYFLGLDQNGTSDRKATLGYGLEAERWFGNLYFSRSLSDRRAVGVDTATAVREITGTEGVRPFVDSITLVTTKQLFQRAYESGVGLRMGHHYEPSNIRLTGGVDYEWGSSDARQTSLSLQAEKFFVGTPHSVALQLDRLRKTGDIDGTRDETRAILSYRYHFGSSSNSQPQRIFRMVQDARPPVVAPIVPEPTVIPARTETTMVKTRATMKNDAFFELSSAKLTPLARTELDRIADLLKSTAREGNVLIVGHSCDLGPEPFNLKLSVKRAEAVRDYLVAAGALKADAVIVEGKGESQPRFPAKKGTREKNRRVDLEFVSVVEKENVVHIPAQTIPGKAPAPVPEPAVTYHREAVEQEPAWMRRALRNPATHKRTVDTYRTQETTQTESTSRVWVNRAPIAQNDVFTVSGGSPSNLAVLLNDNDPDGDILRFVSVTQPTGGNGLVSIKGTELLFSPKNAFARDNFTYTITDGRGASATATVELIDP
jgi:outer membrane protein OmpA-like peptidoglycan-associated protein